MKARLEAALNKRWYGGVNSGLVLKMLSWLYGSLIALRGFCYRSGAFTSTRVSCPVIVVGNFTVGGTGKTPFTIALVQALQSRGWKPGVVSRGYGRKGIYPVTVQKNSTAFDCGDEPVLIFQRVPCALRVDANRVRGAQYLIEQGCDVIIADDGLQHLGLQRDIEIELIDQERKYGNGLLLPAGPLREPPRPCDFKVSNGALEDGPELHHFGMQLVYGDAEKLDRNQKQSLSEFADIKVTAIAGIGHPERFFNALKARGLSVNAIAFPDHHNYTATDFPDDTTVLMTEKDAVKCRKLDLQDAWCVPVDAELNEILFDVINSKLKALSR